MGDYPGAGRHHQGHSGGGYGAPQYGAPAYGAPAYGAPPGPPGGYSAPSYGAPPPGPPPGGMYGAPPGPPGSYGAPPVHGGYGGYGAPPPGPPPMQYDSGPSYGTGYEQPSYNSGGYSEPPRQDYAYNGGGGMEHRGHPPAAQGGWAAPTGQAIPGGYHAASGGYNPANEHQYGQFQGNAPPPRPPPQQQYYGPQMQGGHHGQPQQPFFQYSQCTGSKKALCIGINYKGTSSELKGCINDAQNMSKFLCERFGYKQDDIVMLVDDARNPRQTPTRANMIAAMQWLVAGAKPNDSLFFHYSGHGGQTKDMDGDEDDGNDEVIYPLDFKQAGHLVDDDLHTLLVKPLPAGCRLTAIFDSCHSASALDLPYIYSTEGKIKEPNLLAEAGQGLMSAGVSYLKGDVGGMMSGLMGLGKQFINSQSGAAEKAKQTKTSPADVVSWSGCKDDQTSADTSIAAKATGAMSYAFITALTRYPQQSYMQLLNSLRDELKGKYSQKPQLSASHPMDCNLMFIA
ncbi:Ca(2+)-dependent cysteine protease [Naganishia adeliensis]|uniref:Ca(2+)-dependent cysteine protease n=1 Tax=Naganishia adeliensis TaxID=92952 RepID=A0ACC2WA37_9TREE|nr:Ca(2+)-dependent cysteine protease [Naganishia adeliensis]